MKILVCGLGSMGRRRIRLAKELEEIEAIYGVDTQPERRTEAENLFHIPTFDSVDHALKYDNAIECAFICSAPLTHASLIKRCLNASLHVFTELNLVSDGYEELPALATAKNKKLFLSSTLNYRKDIRYIQEKVHAQSKPSVYLYHVGQYLPDWHPWENYLSYFVADKRTNGCREIMAIDLPWIIRCFGNVASIEADKTKISSLNLDYPDCFSIKIHHENGNTGLVLIDIVSRKSGRKLEIVNEDFYIEWNGTPDSLNDYDSANKKDRIVSCYEKTETAAGYSQNIVENAYRDEIKAFLDLIKKDKLPLWSFEDDAKLLSLVDQIEA